jgi:hypothetical protein
MQPRLDDVLREREVRLTLSLNKYTKFTRGLNRRDLENFVREDYRR